MPNILSWIGMEKERNVLEITKKHTEKIIETVDKLENAFAAYVKGDFAAKDAASREVITAERQADLIRRDLLDQLSEGVLLPPDREDLIHFVKRMDSIADHANAAARLFGFLDKSLPNGIPTKLYEFVKTALLAVNRLGDAIDAMTKNKKNVLAICTEVELLEEQGDEQKKELTGILLKSNLDAGTLILVHDLIEAIEETCDRAEDSADLVRIFAVK
jgi:predicted phosphate transport protein (TIGR00153 family)